MPPKRKKSRVEESDDSSKASDTNPNSGVIRFEVDKVSTLNEEGRYSHEIEVGGLPWSADVRRKKVNGEERLGVYLCSMGHKSKQWRIDVKSDFFLINSDRRKTTTVESTFYTYGNKGNNYGYGILPWKEVVDETEGFIKQDKIVVEIRFSILKTEGLWFSPRHEGNRSRIIIESEKGAEIVDRKSIFSDPGRKFETTDANSLGFIRFELNVADIGSKTVVSQEIQVHEKPWDLRVAKTDKHLKVFLYHAGSDSNIWSFDASARFCLINHFNHNDSIVHNFYDCKYNRDSLHWGFLEFILWNDLINEEKGFVKDGKIIIETRFALFKIDGIRTTPLIDFSDSNDSRHDVTLLIEGEKVHVGKQILAFHSPYFNAMFYGNHIEKSKKEIELKEVDRKVFIEMLHLIYPSYQKITDDNVEPLLKMADYFQINTVIDQAEQFLIDSTKLDIPAKLKLSDQHILVKLQDHCMATFKTVTDVMKLQKSDVYKSLSDKIKAALLDKSMRVSDLD